MPTFTSEFYCGLLIGILLGFLLYYKFHKNKLYDINQKIDKIINLIEPKKRHNNKPSKPFGERSYLPDVEKLWKNFKNLFDKKAGLDPNFSFNQMATEIRELREEKGIAASTLKNFYKRKTNPRKRTLEAIEEWMDNNKEIDANDNDNIINSSDSKEDYGT
jgi:hypothetical protein